MRGKHFGGTENHQQSGITPAHAGKTHPLRHVDSKCRDHPRACGENALRDGSAHRSLGSPPRMRGKLECILNRVEYRGITPAHAGKTQGRERRPEKVGDHPRACGENCFPAVLQLAHTGSPPRMRGKPRPVFLRAFSQGITPAHAGKTMLRQCLFSREGDHPRACGENLILRRFVRGEPGSPPRMRGKRRSTPVGVGGRGITPAHAGKTDSARQAYEEA